jgi:hypothetical protein
LITFFFLQTMVPNSQYPWSVKKRVTVKIMIWKDLKM